MYGSALSKLVLKALPESLSIHHNQLSDYLLVLDKNSAKKRLSYSHSVRYMVKSVAKEAKFSYLWDGKIPLKYCYSAKLYRLALSNTCV